MNIEIVKEAFSDPNQKLQSQRTTRASTDEMLVAAWFGTYDPVDSAGTLKLYRRVVSAFLAWMTFRSLTLSTLVVEDLVEWRDQLRGAPATRANKIAIIKGLVGWAHKTGFLKFNVSSAVKSPKVAIDPDARSLTEMEIAGMVHVARQVLRREQQRTKPRPRYLRAARQKIHLILWLYYSACRISEVANARWQDLHKRPDGDFTLSVLGKGTRMRAVPMPHRIVKEVAGGPLEAKEGRIFPVGIRRLETVVKALAKEAGLGDQVSPHWLRHASASHAVDRGAPIHTVQQTLGHASLQTTGRYLHRGQDGAAKYLAQF